MIYIIYELRSPSLSLSPSLPLSLSLWLSTPLVMHNLIQLANSLLVPGPVLPQQLVSSKWSRTSNRLRSLRFKEFLAEHDFPSDDVNEPRYIDAGHRWFGLLTRYETAPWRASELLMVDVVRFT